MGLGINKDLEPLVRRVRRLGGTVEVTPSTHVLWTLPDGQVIRTGLTMHGTTAARCARQIEAALIAETDSVRFVVQEDDRGKFLVVDAESEAPVLNGNGYPRRFGSRADAARVARKYNAA